MRRSGYRRWGGLGLTGGGEIGRMGSQMPRSPTTNRGSLAAILQEEEEGN
jgi:hypothetical protein